MINVKVNQIVKVINTNCIGLKIDDNSYEAVITKVNAKSFITNDGSKFRMVKSFEDGTALYRNELGYKVVA